MVIGLFGESCTGKSTLAAALAQRIGATVYTGKDYIRLAKNEAEAKKKFAQLLQENQQSGEAIIYVISEKEHLPLLPEKAVRVLVTAELATIKERFAKRLHGNLPAPVAAMLEKRHGSFDNETYSLRIENIGDRVSDICDQILSLQ